MFNDRIKKKIEDNNLCYLKCDYYFHTKFILSDKKMLACNTKSRNATNEYPITRNFFFA